MTAPFARQASVPPPDMTTEWRNAVEALRAAQYRLAEAGLDEQPAAAD